MTNANKALLLQPARVPLGMDSSGGPVLISREWYRQLQDIADAHVVAANEAAVAALSASVDAMALELDAIVTTDIVAPAPANEGNACGEITFAPVNWFPVANIVLPVFVDNETPAGAIDGSNTVYVLAHGPLPASSLSVWLNGLRLAPGVDYTLSGVNLTYMVTPAIGSWHVVSYRY